MVWKRWLPLHMVIVGIYVRCLGCISKHLLNGSTLFHRSSWEFHGSPPPKKLFQWSVDCWNRHICWWEPTLWYINNPIIWSNLRYLKMAIKKKLSYLWRLSRTHDGFTLKRLRPSGSWCCCTCPSHCSTWSKLALEDGRCHSNNKWYESWYRCIVSKKQTYIYNCIYTHVYIGYYVCVYWNINIAIFIYQYLCVFIYIYISGGAPNRLVQLVARVGPWFGWSNAGVFMGVG